MAAPPIVSELPAAPNRNDAPADFSTKADAFVAALPPMVSQENTLATWMYTTSQEISGYATGASTSATNAASSATAAQAAQAAATAQAAAALASANNAAASATAAEAAPGSIGNLALMQATALLF